MSQMGVILSATTPLFVETITGNSGGAVGPTLGNINLVGTGNITVVGTPGTSTLTITPTGLASFSWTQVSGISQAMSINSGYIANNAGLLTFTLPTVASQGSVMRIVGKLGLWTIAQNAGQVIHFGAVNTTVGAGGSLSAILQYDCVELLCTTSNTDFTVMSVMGNLTPV